MPMAAFLDRLCHREVAAMAESGFDGRLFYCGVSANVSSAVSETTAFLSCQAEKGLSRGAFREWAPPLRDFREAGRSNAGS
jgi:hypothetical protein